MSAVKTEAAVVLVGAVSVVAAGANHGLLWSLDWQLAEPPVQTGLAPLWTVRLRSVQACPRTMRMRINNAVLSSFFLQFTEKMTLAHYRASYELIMLHNDLIRMQ